MPEDMDSNQDRPPGLALPQPSAGQGTAGGHSGEPNAQEIRGESQVVTPTAASPVASTSFSPVPTTPPPTSVVATGALPSEPSSSEDDGDVLDKEWVKKAKVIVEANKADPFKESQELSKAKADYLRVRYSKHIKVDEQQ